MSAHTLGPWEAWGDQVGHKHRKDKLGRPMRTTVAVVILETRGHAYDESRAIRDADAKLIAAAPMLYDALGRLYVKLVKADWPDFDDEMDIAKAALLDAGRLP